MHCRIRFGREGDDAGLTADDDVVIGRVLAILPSRRVHAARSSSIVQAFVGDRVLYASYIMH
jgi:hypothetical protein